MKTETKFGILRIALAIIISLLISFSIIFLVSKNGMVAIRSMIVGPLQTKRRIREVLDLMVPLTFTGVGVSLMFSAKQINLGSEGSFHLGGLVATIIILSIGLPSFLSPLTAIIVAGIAGSLITGIIAVIKIKTGASELITSLLMNYIVLLFSNYILNYKIKDVSAGGNASRKIPEALKLQRLGLVHWGFIIAIFVVIFAYIFLYKTKLGYTMRISGSNEKFAKYSGINTIKIILISQLLGGFIAGMGGGVQLLSMYERFTWVDSLKYGWDAVIVSTIANDNPIFVPLAAFFLAYIRVGADAVNRVTDLTPDFIAITQGVIIILIVAKRFLAGFKQRAIAKESLKKIEREEQ